MLAALVAIVVLVVVTDPDRLTSGRGGVVSGDLPVASLARPDCGYTSLLVPNCGRWWGITPFAHTSTPIAAGLNQEEHSIGRPVDILHVYHKDAELFPTTTERRLALEPGRQRILLINWKPATRLTWREVADGGVDARIDTLAAHIEATWRHPFFLTIWHEPENDVLPSAGSGMTATDYAAMYRHVVLRLRADGVDKAVTVMDYIAFDKWAHKAWFASLWPGDDVVDWIGLDPYGTGARTGYNAHTFKTLVDRPEGSFPGYYTWATMQHPGKPIMLAEWGVEASSANPSGQARFFTNVRSSLGEFPKIKALVYFDIPGPPVGEPLTSLRAGVGSLPAYRALGRSAAVVAPQVTYQG